MVVSVAGSLLAVAVPEFARNWQASLLAEPIQGLEHIAGRASSLAAGRSTDWAFPESVGLTPSDVPRGRAQGDAAGTWDHPTWKELHFRFDRSHSFAFSFDGVNGPSEAHFSARAHGDLDGDGVLSTFRISGSSRSGQLPTVQILEMYREIE